MKKKGPLNSEIAKILADLGHTDTVVIADCGLPIPKDIPKIDLAITVGVPCFKDILALFIEEMVIEKVTIADEMNSNNKALYNEVSHQFTEIDTVSHEKFKKLTKEARVVVRTGESTPYANIILHAGVIFS
ncbi:D-ribose pyranase [Jeotgalibacillus soli]|uniref:D-ribose pyranase n=1 Tax=Jeotgalibacillus soli TaxID=889306 RepID=A0A0C2S6B8_9BACL|nr:D-ribose pyranase [Jeotgalibacillus soli]KIL49559.1 ribose pyranase [Jeotgalibacillus soli]